MDDILRDPYVAHPVICAKVVRYVTFYVYHIIWVFISRL